MPTVAKLTITLLITVLIASTVSADGWSTDVLISSHDSVFAVELESSHLFASDLFAVIAHVEDGDNKWSTYRSSDGGDSWTHTFTRTTTTLTSISCANDGLLFYVLAGEYRPRMFRFFVLDGSQMDFSWGQYATVDPDNRWYDVVVTSPDKQTIICAVGEYGGVNLAARVSIYGELDYWWDMEPEKTDVDRGLDASITESGALFVSYYTPDDYIKIVRDGAPGAWVDVFWASSVVSGDNTHTSIFSEFGDDGPSALTVCAYEWWSSPRQLRVVASEDLGDTWTSDNIEYVGRSCSAPAITCEGNGVGLAYSTRLTTSPFFKSTAYHWDLTPELMADDTEETWATELVDLDIKPDIEYFNGFYGIAYVSSTGNGQAWFTRTLSCCQIRADINHDGTGPDIADLVYLVTYMFQSGPSPICNEDGYYAEADVNGDLTGPDIADLVYLVTYMFQSGPAPVPCE